MVTKISYEEARKILGNADLPGFAGERITAALSTKELRRESILEKENEQERRISAAIEIQRVWRGYRTRCKLFGILHPDASVKSIVFGSRFAPSPSRLSDVRTVTPTFSHITSQEPDLSDDAFPKTKKKYKEYCEHTIREQGPSYKVMTYMEFCAVLIQNWWRLMLLNPDVPRPPPPTISRGLSGTGAAAERSGTADTERSEEKKILDREEAAKVIQRSWRKHIDMQVYRYYRDLINFKNRGDPSSMLKCINPREAELLDAASGVHIKFRLAGEKFPPNIYYKIFTHRNIVDVCANAPRDYTQAVAKRFPAEYIHNKGNSMEGDDRSGWYQRWENNGWRLVSDRVMRRVDQDPVVYESTLKKELFSHDKVVRRQDLERKRKRKKLEWMKKMYKEGRLKARQGENAETGHMVRSVAAGIMAITDRQGHDAVEDWEVDELLEWTNGLNFDKYLFDWKEVATSAGSEFQTEQTNFLPDDPFSLTLMSR